MTLDEVITLGEDVIIVDEAGWSDVATPTTGTWTLVPCASGGWLDVATPEADTWVVVS